jgi:hypothetical protein
MREPSGNHKGAEIASFFGLKEAIAMVKEGLHHVGTIGRNEHCSQGTCFVNCCYISCALF